jgi:hypothetical protein
MSRKAFLVAALCVLAVLSSLVLSAQTPPWQARGGRIQNLYAWVEGVNTDREDAAYNIKPAEPVDVEVGEEVKVSLWAGNVSDDDEEVDASFSVAAGRDRIQITGSGDNWVRVRVRGGSGGVAQLGYEVDGDYNMPGGLRSGRITFEIE